MDDQRGLRWIIVLLLLSPPVLFTVIQMSRENTLLKFGYYTITLMYYLLMLFKMTVMRVTFDKTESLINYFNAHVFHRDDPVSYRLRRKTYFVTWKIFFSLAAFNVFNMFAFMALTKPTSSYIGFGNTEISWYHVVLVQMNGVFALLHQCVYATSILVVSFLMHWFQTELEILAKGFGKIFHEKPPLALWKSDNRPRVWLQREEIKWTGIERRLVYCISRHGEIIEMMRILRKIVEPIFLGLGFYIVTMISTLIFVMIKDNRFNFMGFVHVLVIIIEFYYYAHLVDDLDDKNHLIADAIYDQDWFGQMKHSRRFAKHYKSVKSMILIVIMHSQRPFRFTCGGLYKMTVPVFTTMIETLYFAVTFMLRTIKIQR
ncbi:uncharacterized protein LOC135702966 [Ochlerotatus camptorhynchus]|uniref:uncharacterized protein LOC135702966 n=1 Tax=Ochlerotatus camptorhynchus TaxID=644619 RepID=UPI0031D870C3